MSIGRPRTFVLTLSDIERTQLQDWAASRSLPHALVQRAQAILLSADGLANTEVAARIGRVIQWWATGAAASSRSAWRASTMRHAPVGRAPMMTTKSPDSCARCLRRSRPMRRTGVCGRWLRTRASARARCSAISCSSVSSRTAPKASSCSTDPVFVEKVRDVVGLYLNPPENALVLCVDEKSQIQALERTQPLLAARARLRRRRSPTTTSGMGPPRCSPRSMC